MKKHKLFSTAHSVRTAAVSAALALALAGCSSGSIGSNDYAPHDLNTKHPIQVRSEAVSTVIAIPANDGDAPSVEDARRLRNFIVEYVGRGRSLVIVETQMGDRARAFLQSQGLRADELQIISDTTLKAPNAALSFTTNTAVVPECGDWSDNTTFSPNNAPYKDFGCSNRRNLGLSVADPGDLIDHQPVSSSSAGRNDALMDKYNAGEPISAPPAPIDTRAVSGAAN